MNDEQLREERLKMDRGREAAQLLDNDLFNEAFDAVGARLVAIMSSAKTDAATLKAKEMLGLLNDVKAHVSLVVKDGAMAVATIRMDEKMQEERKRWYHKWTDIKWGA